MKKSAEMRKISVGKFFPHGNWPRNSLSANTYCDTLPTLYDLALNVKVGTAEAMWRNPV